MEFTATAKYVRMSPRKVGLVARAMKSLRPKEAIARLKELPKRAAGPLVDVIASALANAKEKKADEGALTIKTIEVLPGPVMKRWHAVSRGQAHAYKKRMTHIKIVLTDDTIKSSGKSVKGGNQMSARR